MSDVGEGIKPEESAESIWNRRIMLVLSLFSWNTVYSWFHFYRFNGSTGSEGITWRRYLKISMWRRTSPWNRSFIVFGAQIEFGGIAVCVIGWEILLPRLSEFQTPLEEDRTWMSDFIHHTSRYINCPATECSMHAHPAVAAPPSIVYAGPHTISIGCQQLTLTG